MEDSKMGKPKTRKASVWGSNGTYLVKCTCGLRLTVYGTVEKAQEVASNHSENCNPTVTIRGKG